MIIGPHRSHVPLYNTCVLIGHLVLQQHNRPMENCFTKCKQTILVDSCMPSFYYVGYKREVIVKSVQVVYVNFGL